MARTHKTLSAINRNHLSCQAVYSYAFTLSGMSWWNYVVETAGTENQSVIAKKLGLSQPSISQWKTSSPKKETVRRFAEKYEVPVVRAFIAAGYLTEDEAREICD